MKKIFLSLMMMVAMINIANSQVVFTDLSNNPVVITGEYEINLMGGEAEFMIQNYSSYGEAIYFASFADGAAVVSTEADYNANVDVIIEGSVIGSGSMFFGCEGGSPYFNVLYLKDTYTQWDKYSSPQFVGFKFKNGDDIHYGWAEVSVTVSETNTDQMDVTLYGYAYESTPGTFIKAGSTVSLGINETISDITINIYPNPANEIVSVNSEKIINKIEISNALGQNVLNVTNNYENINISSLHKGVYYINVLTEDGIKTTKFIKQ